MALAFDTFTADATGLPASSLSWNHTCSGNNRILLVGIGGGGTTGDCITGITYNSVAMTRVPTNGYIASGDVTAWVYYLINPTSGSNTIAVSSSSPQFIRGIAVSYTGARQTSQPDGSNNAGAAPGTSVATSVTTTADNCWNISLGMGASGSLSASTGISSVRGNRDSVDYFGDSNGPKTPAGSYGMTWTAGSQNLAAIQVSIAPSIATSGFLMFM